MHFPTCYTTLEKQIPEDHLKPVYKLAEHPFNILFVQKETVHPLKLTIIFKEIPCFPPRMALKSPTRRAYARKAAGFFKRCYAVLSPWKSSLRTDLLILPLQKVSPQRRRKRGTIPMNHYPGSTFSTLPNISLFYILYWLYQSLLPIYFRQNAASY